MSPENTDLIYASVKSQVKDFTFDAQVVEVFPDMIMRSVPGYHTIIDTIGRLSQQFVKENSNIYDLGCSLGAATLAMRKGITKKGCKIIGIDNSSAMVARCNMHVNAFKGKTPVEIIEGDILTASLENASMVVLNFTLQFIDKQQRQQLIDTIFQALLPGGLLIISEKVSHENSTIDELLINLHHEFKRTNGYSELEVAQKRTALENVMKTDSLAQHHQRLSSAGFTHVSPWFQCFNFTSIIAIK